MTAPSSPQSLRQRLHLLLQNLHALTQGRVWVGELRDETTESGRRLLEADDRLAESNVRLLDVNKSLADLDERIKAANIRGHQKSSQSSVAGASEGTARRGGRESSVSPGPVPWNERGGDHR